VSVVEYARAEGKRIHSWDWSSSLCSGEGIAATVLRSGSCAVFGRDVGAKVGWRNAMTKECAGFKRPVVVGKIFSLEVR